MEPVRWPCTYYTTFMPSSISLKRLKYDQFAFDSLLIFLLELVLECIQYNIIKKRLPRGVYHLHSIRAPVSLILVDFVEDQVAQDHICWEVDNREAPNQNVASPDDVRPVSLHGGSSQHKVHMVDK
jgi:hypothetical protein